MSKHFIVALILLVLVPRANAQREVTASVQSIELNGEWRFREATTGTWHPASVPGCVHTDLLKNKLIPDPFFGTNEKELQWIGEKDWIYETLFDLPPGLLARQNIEVVFRGLDTYASVTLNDTLLLTADNMFREWRKECRSHLKPKGNVLTIRFRNVFDENLPKYRSAPYRLQAFSNNDQSDIKISMYSRKAQFHYGWDWGPRLITCGVWRPVLLVGWTSLKIKAVRFVEENVSPSGAEITSFVEMESEGSQRAHVQASADGIRLGERDTLLHNGLNVVALKGKIDHPKLWWTNGLGSQYLYSINVSAVSRNGCRDESTTKIGVRSLEVVRDRDSLGTSLYVRLNGVPVFMKGADYIPQDNFQHRVTPERHEFMIRSAAQANMNMLRVWGGGIYEDDLFYDLCDRYGILLWHDMMFACAMYPADDRFLESVRHEVVDNVRRIRHHPCIALYCGNNENEISWSSWGWKQLYPPAGQEICERNLRRLFHEVIPDALREADPSRYYHSSSPNAGFADISPMNGDIHYWGVWHGKEPFETFDQNIARFVSEYGFQSYPQFSSIEKFTEAGDRELHSPVMLSHQRCMADDRRDTEYGNRLIASYMEKYLGTPNGFSAYLYASQVLQAEGVRMAIEAHRRNKPTCMGSLYWQIDDCWPVASWSSIDYYGEWKALHYYARRLYEPVIIAPRVVDEEVGIHIVSDRLEPLACELEVRIVDFWGTEVFKKAIPVTIEANASGVYATFHKNELLHGHDETTLVMVSRLGSADGMLAENLTYFRYPKDLQLQHPEIRVAATKEKEGYSVELESNTLAKNVYLHCQGVAGFFTDNYFDLLPHTVKRLEFRNDKEVRDFRDRLTMMSLVDMYIK